MQQTIANLSHEMELSRIPQLMVGQIKPNRLQRLIQRLSERFGLRPLQWTTKINPQKEQIHTFGTRRHWYLAMEATTAHQLQLDLTTQPTVTKAILIHELHHFTSGDYWQLGYLAKLFQQTGWLWGWGVLFSIGMGLLLVLVAVEFLTLDIVDFLNQLSEPFSLGEELASLLPAQSEIDILQEQAQNINLGEATFLTVTFFFTVFMPFVIVTSILWLFFWPKLWRTREFYADAEVVHQQKSINPYRSALTGIPSVAFLNSASTPTHEPVPQKPFRQQLWQWLKQLRTNHPLLEIRLAALHHPTQIFDQWFKTGLLVGSLALLINIILQTPLTFFFLNRVTVHFSTLIIFIVAALSLIPLLVQGHKTYTAIVGLITIAIGIQSIFIIFAIGAILAAYFIAPEALDTMLTNAVVVMSGQTALSPQDYLFGSELSAYIVGFVKSGIAQTIFPFLLLIVALFIINWFLRRLFYWYAYPNADRRLMQIAYGLISIFAIFLILAVLPLLTTIWQEPAELSSLFIWFWVLIGSTIFGLGLAWFIKQDRLYAHFCPACQRKVEGDYELGKTCNHCGQRLHPWLLVEYEG
ncbi:MAG: hypothetical protein KDE48_19095 [Anaerolineales bacterium]|nr:hypothetical protein [Anaerolineales bacterium]